LVTGSVALLTFTIVILSWILIDLLANQWRKSVILQGRNIALSGERALLRSDPEYDLHPLITRISNRDADVVNVVVTDAAGITVGDLELQNLYQKFEEPNQYEELWSEHLEAQEALYRVESSMMAKVPVWSLGKIIGWVYLSYSERQLHAALRRSWTISGVCVLGAFILAIAASLGLFRHISRPVDSLIAGVDAFRLGDMNRRIDPKGASEFRILARSFNRMAKRVVSAQDAVVEKRVTDRELEIAHDIQSTLIPNNVQAPEGYQIALSYQPAKQVGGDYVDVIALDDQRVAIVVADVSGKGIPGLAITAMLKIMLHELALREPSPMVVLRELNKAIAKHIRRYMFVTVFLAILDTRAGVLKLSSAGHCPTLIYRHDSQSLDIVRMHVPPIGVFPDEEFSTTLTEETIELAVGDMMLQYTDGVVESMDSGGEMFGYDRLYELFKVHAPDGSDAVIESLIRGEADFRRGEAVRDDQSTIAVRRTVAAEEPLTRQTTLEAS
jgi:sigma-B regulation protein RsbU (phosphoserine phosphatase)